MIAHTLPETAARALARHLLECDAFIHGHLVQGKDRTTPELPAAYKQMTLSQKGRLHHQLLGQYIRGEITGNESGSMVKGPVRRVKTLLQLIQDGVPMAYLGGEDDQHDGNALGVSGTRVQHGCEDMLEELVATIRLPVQWFGTMPGPVCEGYVLLLQAYMLAGYASGRFSGLLSLNHQGDRQARLQAPVRLLNAIPTTLNSLALLAFVRAEVDLAPVFPNGVRSVICRKQFSLGDEHVMRLVLQALQDQAGKMKQGFDAAVAAARGASGVDWVN